MSQSGTKKFKGIAYYHCSNKTGCGKYCEQTEIEQQVAEKFKDFEFSQDFIDEVVSQAKHQFLERRRIYEGRKQALVNKKTALESRRKIAEDKLLENIISDEDFTRIRLDTTAQLKQIDDQLFSIEAEQGVDISIVQDVLLLARDIYKAYNKASFNLKRQLLGLFWERFEVADGVILKSVSSPLFQELLTAEKVYFKNQKKQEIAKDALIQGDSEKVILANLGLRG